MENIGIIVVLVIGLISVLLVIVNLAGIYNEKSGIDTAVIKPSKIEVDRNLLITIRQYILENEKFMDELYDTKEDMPEIFTKIDSLLK